MTPPQRPSPAPENADERPGAPPAPASAEGRGETSRRFTPAPAGTRHPGLAGTPRPAPARITPGPDSSPSLRRITPSPDSAPSSRGSRSPDSGGSSSRSLGAIAMPLIRRLTRLQARHPFLMLLAAAISVALAVMLARQLKLKTSLGELLPANKQSVIVAERVAERLPDISTFALAIEGTDDEGLKRFVDHLAPELQKLPRDLVGTVDYGVQATRKFFEEKALLYAPLDLVREVHDEIIARHEYEVAKQADLLLDDSDPPPPLTEESIRKRIEERTKSQGGAQAVADQYPDGYYLDTKNHVAAIVLRTPISAGDAAKVEELKTEVGAAVERARPHDFDPTIRVGYTGGLISSVELYESVKNDLSHIGMWGGIMILGVVFLYYLRLRTLLAMALTVSIGTAWTFGVTYLAIGHLNSSTGLLFSIVVGNGINFGIIYMARYMEARRRSEVETSVLVAHRDTWLATLAASGAATAAYGSLAVTDFRGFRHFGIIGGSGMLLCWLATYLFLPALLCAMERIWPVRRSFIDRLRANYGRPFAFLASRLPRSIAVGSLLIAVGATILAVRYLAEDPLEYDLDNINNEQSKTPSEWKRLNSLLAVFLARQQQDGKAVVTDRLDQVLPLEAALEARRDAAPEGLKPFDKVVTIFDLLPTEQVEKIALIDEARGRLDSAHRKGFISDEDWKKLQDYLPKGELAPLDIDTLPEQVARPFTEKDGTRGRLVYVVPTTGRSVWDAHYLLDLADSFRETTLPDGSVVEGSGDAVIYADLILNVVEDAPKAVIVSLGTTLLIVLIAFRARRSGLWAMASVLFGIACMLAVLSVWKSKTGDDGKFVLEPLRLNFLNFVAIPITIGVGADYGVNVMQRYASGSRRDIRTAVVETGGAVILCSLTTMLGYFALTLSVNLAVRSFGIAAAVGEVCCLLGAVLAMPAWLQWLENRRIARRDAAHPRSTSQSAGARIARSSEPRRGAKGAFDTWP